ncbi:protein gustavus-like [Clytia hemisphaerica]|uniref:SPRY domain-containing SOCS box protein n=1 Tax=Clytia hemisphaerica TaxID=252671 RepID=A0A069DNC9_9CNID|eukprot:TCONS_00028727-protein
MGSRISSAKRTTETLNNGKETKIKRRGLKHGCGKRDTLNQNENCFPRPRKLEILLDRPPASRKVQEYHGWNTDDRSMNIYVKEDDCRISHRHPVAQSTDAIRGKVGFSKGLHVWDYTWSTRQRGTHAVVGIATKKANLHCAGYHCLVGANQESWGWDLGRNKLFHNEKVVSSQTYPKNLGSDANFIVPDTIRCILDMDRGELSFEVDGQYLGVAFTGLQGQTVYPIVSAVWGHCEVKMNYIGGLEPEPLPLMDLCRLTIRQQVGKENLTQDTLDSFNIPRQMKQYLVYKW